MQRGLGEAVLHNRRQRREAEPDHGVAGGQHEGRDDRLALARRGVGDLGIGEDHGAGARQHHRQDHRRPHQGDHHEAHQAPVRARHGQHRQAEGRLAGGREQARQEIERPHAGPERAGRAAHAGDQQRQPEPAEPGDGDDADAGEPFRPRQHAAQPAGGLGEVREAAVGALCHDGGSVLRIRHSASAGGGVSTSWVHRTGPPPAATGAFDPEMTKTGRRL